MVRTDALRVNCVLENHADPTRTVRVSQAIVDTGSDYTWIPEKALKKIGVVEQKRDLSFVVANRQTITRSVGFAIIRVNGHFTIDEVVFARKGDLRLLGARTLEGLNLHVDAKNNRLVAGGPLTVAQGAGPVRPSAAPGTPGGARRMPLALGESAD